MAADKSPSTNRSYMLPLKRSTIRLVAVESVDLYAGQARLTLYTVLPDSDLLNLGMLLKSAISIFRGR